MARTTAQVDGATSVLPKRDASPIPLDTPAWFGWLEHATTFAFRSPLGRFTARKERQARGGGYWKAYRTVHGTLHRVDLGKAQKLTLDRLNHAAQQTLETYTELARQRGFVTHLVARGIAAQAQLALAQGNLAAAVAWADASGRNAADDLSFPREAEYLILARVCIAQAGARRSRWRATYSCTSPRFLPPVAKNPPTAPPLVGCGSTHPSAMLCLLMIRDRAERMMTLHYQISVKEYLEDSWSEWFDGLAISHAADGTTTLAGPVRDQSALYGLIDKARDLGLTLVAVGRSDPPGFASEPLA